MRHIYRVTRDERRVGYGETVSGVVVAANAKRARELMRGTVGDQYSDEWFRSDTQVYRLGLAASHLAERVVHESFNAG